MDINVVRERFARRRPSGQDQPGSKAPNGTVYRERAEKMQAVS